MPTTYDFCKQEMIDGAGCIGPMITIGGQEHERLRHESKRWRLASPGLRHGTLSPMPSAVDKLRLRD